MSYEKALEAFKQLYEDVDKDNWLFVGTINPDDYCSFAVIKE